MQLAKRSLSPSLCFKGIAGTPRIRVLLSGVRNFIALTQETEACTRKQARGFVALVPQHINADPPGLGNAPLPKTNGVDLSIEQQEMTPLKDADPSEKWKEITVEMWRDAVYTNQTYFGELISDTSEFVKTIAEHIKLSGRRVSLVEVGCGTGEFVRSSSDDFRTVVGVDFNKEFIDFCKDHTAPRHMSKSRYIQGDACQLQGLLEDAFSKHSPADQQPWRSRVLG